MSEVLTTPNNKMGVELHLLFHFVLYGYFISTCFVHKKAEVANLVSTLSQLDAANELFRIPKSTRHLRLWTYLLPTYKFACTGTHL